MSFGYHHVMRHMERIDVGTSWAGEVPAGPSLLAVPKRPNLKLLEKSRIYFWSSPDVPEYLRKHHITAFYRPRLTWRHALCSIFSLHNETLNIWSHLCGALLMAVLGLTFARTPVPSSPLSLWRHSASGAHAFGRLAHQLLDATLDPSSDVRGSAPPRWPLVFFDLAAATTLLLSACAHAFACLSPDTSAVLWRLDQAGISLGISAAFIPGCLYVFGCEPRSVPLGYLVVVLAMAAACVAVNALGFLPARMKRQGRVVLYFLLTLTSAAPLSRAIQLYWHVCAIRSCVLGIGVTIAVAAAGGAVYALHVPERWLPGVFDLFGHSHQIFHVLVVAGFVIHHFNCLGLWLWWSSNRECPPFDPCPDPFWPRALV